MVEDGNAQRRRVREDGQLKVSIPRRFERLSPRLSSICHRSCCQPGIEGDVGQGKSRKVRGRGEVRGGREGEIIVGAGVESDDYQDDPSARSTECRWQARSVRGLSSILSLTCSRVSTQDEIVQQEFHDSTKTGGNSATIPVTDSPSGSERKMSA